MSADSKLVQARKIMSEGLFNGIGFAFGGFVAAATTDLFREWRTGKQSSVYEASVTAKRGSAVRKCCARPTFITRI